MSIQIVYFANIFVNRSHGHILIREQLTDLVKTGLTEIATLHIVLSVPSDYNHVNLQSSLTHLFPSTHKVIFHICHESCHEFPGIQLVYQLALKSPSRQDIILYFHSKSITRFKGRRENVEIMLHSTVVAPWKKVLGIFMDHPSIDKIGSTCSTNGWIWWNYWWVRASYVASVENPIKTARRYYYEDWLSRRLINPAKQSMDPLRPEEDRENRQIYNISNANCWGLSHKMDFVGRGCKPPEAIAFLLRRRR